jgi:hypothetical protein
MQYTCTALPTSPGFDLQVHNSVAANPHALLKASTLVNCCNRADNVVPHKLTDHTRVNVRCAEPHTFATKLIRRQVNKATALL